MTHETDEQDKVIAKIEKLLSLAQSSNENEARLAASKAAELLTMYNLTIEQVQMGKNEYIDQCITKYSKRNQQDKFVTIILQEFFFVRILRTRYYSFKKMKRMTAVRLVGTKTNVQIAMQVHTFLSMKFTELWQAYRISHNAKVQQKQSYMNGLCNGLFIQLLEQREACESKTGLMVIKDQKLEDHIMNDIGAKVNNVKINADDEQALEDGMEHGKEIRIQKGIEHKKEHKGNLLQVPTLDGEE